MWGKLGISAMVIVATVILARGRMVRSDPLCTDTAVSALVIAKRWRGIYIMISYHMHESNCPLWRWSARCKKHFK
jgi:hypothetical protein